MVSLQSMRRIIVGLAMFVKKFLHITYQRNNGEERHLDSLWLLFPKGKTSNLRYTLLHSCSLCAPPDADRLIQIALHAPFREQQLFDAILDFQSRERRFGNVKQMIQV